MAGHAPERKVHLRKCLELIERLGEERDIIYGGDLILLEKELAAVGRWGASHPASGTPGSTAAEGRKLSSPWTSSGVLTWSGQTISGRETASTGYMCAGSVLPHWLGGIREDCRHAVLPIRPLGPSSEAVAGPGEGSCWSSCWGSCGFYAALDIQGRRGKPRL